MDTRSRILQAAADLLADSSTGDITTRAVGEAAGVQQPVIYRLFGDKDQLLAAVVDHGFEQYLATKRAAVPTEDPMADLRRGWDAHTAFALAHPNLYRLMYAPGLTSLPHAVQEAHELLLGILDRIARIGRLATSPDRAAGIVMAANSGVALALITRPERYPDPELSVRVRETVLPGILTTTDDSPVTSGATDLAAAATTLLARLRATQPTPFSDAELGLLTEWLQRLAQ